MPDIFSNLVNGRQGGDLANTDYMARPGLYIGNGSTYGTQTITLGGTVSLAPQSYIITYTNLQSGQSYSVPGTLLLSRTQQTLLGATAALAKELRDYQDVTATANGATIVITPKARGINAVLAFVGGTLTVATTVSVSALGVSRLLPGSIVAFDSAVNGSGVKNIKLPSASPTANAANYGVVLGSQMGQGTELQTTENITYDILTQGTVWTLLRGGSALVDATVQLQLGWATSATAGGLSVTGATAANFDLIDLRSATNNLTKFNALDRGVPVGQFFRLELS